MINGKLIENIKNYAKILVILSYLQSVLTLPLLFYHLALVIVVIVTFLLIYHTRKFSEIFEEVNSDISVKKYYLAEYSLDELADNIKRQKTINVIFVVGSFFILALLLKFSPFYLYLVFLSLAYIISIVYCIDINTELEKLKEEVISCKIIKEKEEREEKYRKEMMTRFLHLNLVDKRKKPEEDQVNRNVQNTDQKQYQVESPKPIIKKTTNPEVIPENEIMCNQIENDNDQSDRVSIATNNTNTINNMIKTILRWLILLPLSIIAYFISYRIFMWCNMEFVGLYFMNRIIECFGCGFSSACFVITGAMVAPSRKNIVAYVLSGIGILLSILGLALLFVKPEDFDWWMLFAYTASIVGCTAGVSYIVSEIQSEDLLTFDKKDWVIGILVGVVFLLVAIICLSKCSPIKENSNHSMLYEEATKDDNKSHIVYICTGGSSKKYHRVEDCEWLQNCSGYIKPVTIENAEGLGRTPCKSCCK